MATSLIKFDETYCRYRPISLISRKPVGGKKKLSSSLGNGESNLLISFIGQPEMVFVWKF
jgi:hypothetical protein